MSPEQAADVQPDAGKQASKKPRFDPVILHELAHSYHDQVLGFDEPRFKAAYEKEMEEHDLVLYNLMVESGES